MSASATPAIAPPDTSLLARVRAFLEEPSAARRLPLFLWVFAAYLAIRGIGYPDLVLVIPCALLLPFDATRRWAALAAIVVDLSVLRRYLPLISNHGLFEIWILVLLVLVDARAERPATRAALVRTLMAALVVLILWTGVQKMLHGYYTSGEYFTAELAQPGKFADRLSWILPESERKVLEGFRASLREMALTSPSSALAPPSPRPETLVLLSRLACWSTLVAELGLPFLLAWRRTRLAAAALLALFFLGVEAAADEWHFALLVLALMLLFLPMTAFPSALLGSSPDRGAESERTPVQALAAITLLMAVLLIWPAFQYRLTCVSDLNPWKLGGFAMYSVPGRWDASRIDICVGRDPAWRPFSKKDPGVPKEILEGEEEVIKNTPFEPFASAAVLRIAAIVRACRPDATAVRLRSRTVVHDLGTGRFAVLERIYVAP